MQLTEVYHCKWMKKRHLPSLGRYSLKMNHYFPQYGFIGSGTTATLFANCFFVFSLCPSVVTDCDCFLTQKKNNSNWTLFLVCIIIIFCYSTGVFNVVKNGVHKSTLDYRFESSLPHFVIVPCSMLSPRGVW